MMNKIFVGNLSYQASEEDLETAFGQYGTIEQVSLIRDKFTDKLRGFGFITFTTEEGAQNALAMNDQELLGRKVNVSIARERERSNNNRGGGQRRQHNGDRYRD